MTDAGSLRGRLLLWLALLLLLKLLLASGLSAYWNGREVADTAYDRTLLASARAIADGLYEKDGTLRADVPYVALDTFAYDSAGRIFYQVNDIHGRMISGYENLPAAPADTLRTDDYPALAKFYDGVYQGVDVRVVSLLQPVSEPSMSGMAEIRVAETEGARERMARSPDDRYPVAPGRPRRRRAGAGVAGGERRAASAGSPAPRGGRAPAGRPAAVADARGPA